MAVDRGYGSGKPRSAANSAARRAAADKAASRKKTIKRQASNPGVRLGVSRVGKQENSAYNIGGRQYLETGISLNPLMGAIKALLPQSVRVAGAASRVVKGATSRLSAAEARIAAGEGMQAAGLAVKQSARNVPKTPRSVRLGLDWDNPVGNRPHQSYNYVIKDMTKGVNPEAPRSAWEISEAGRQMMNAGSNTAYNAAKAARRSQRVIDAGKAEAAAEIKRRLAVLRRANRNR